MSLADDFTAAIGQLGDGRFLGVVLKALVLTLAVLGLSIWAVLSLLSGWIPETLWLPFWGDIPMWSGVLTGAALILLLGLSVFLMIPVAALCVGFFLDDIVDAVERKHYPDLPPIDPLPLSDVLIDSAKFALLVIALNLAALVVYVLATVLAPFVFWGLNGYLLGREYFQLVAGRRLGVAGAKALRRRHRAEVWLAGALMALPLTVPVVNLFVPVLGVATYTHMFHRLKGP